METNQISIQVSSGNMYVGDLETVETGNRFFDFLENEIDETKKLILTVLRLKGSVAKFVDEFLVSMDTKEQWELHVAVKKYSTFLVLCYNRSYLTLDSENPILLRHSKPTTDDVLIETMNENNWHQFLSDSIRDALDNPQVVDKNRRLHLERQWIRNIFTRLNKCFRIYAMFFEELASTYKELVFSDASNNRIKTYKFAKTPFRSFGSMQDKILYEELYFKVAEKYFGTGKTTLSVSPKNLQEIRPPSHLDSSTTLPRSSSPRVLGHACEMDANIFFHNATFQESVERSESSKLVITNALEEFLFNCSAKVMKSDKDLLVFEQM